MSSIESFIVIVALVSAAGGSLMLLACLAGKRSQLVKAYNMKREIEQREKMMEMQNEQASEGEDIPGMAQMASSGGAVWKYLTSRWIFTLVFVVSSRAV